MKKFCLILAIILCVLTLSGCKKGEEDLAVNYDITVEFFDNNTLTATQTVTVKNTKNHPLKK